MSGKNRVNAGSYIFSCTAHCDFGRPISRPRRPISVGASVADSQRSSASPDATCGSAACAKGSKRHQSAEDDQYTVLGSCRICVLCVMAQQCLSNSDIDVPTQPTQNRFSVTRQGNHLRSGFVRCGPIKPALSVSAAVDRKIPGNPVKELFCVQLAAVEY